MNEYLDAIIRPLLSVPEAFSIARTTDDLGVLLTLEIHKDDMGQLIGKGGQNASAIRRIMNMYGIRNNAKISIKINEPIGGKFHSEIRTTA